MKIPGLAGMLVVTASSIVSVISYGGAAPSARHDDDQDRGRICRSETLKGNYGVIIGGTRPAAGFPPGTIEQVNGVGTQSFDGDGNFTQVTAEKSSVTGTVTTRSGFGTYVVDADCTGTLTLTVPGVPFPIVSDFVIVNGGKEFHTFVASPPPSMISTTAKRTH